MKKINFLGFFISVLLTLGFCSIVNAESQDWMDDNTYEKIEEQIDKGEELISDPLEGMNRSVFYFNYKVRVYLIDPVNTAWRKVPVIPTWIDNVLGNLMSPLYFLGAVLQGKPERAGLVAGEFVVNSILGLGGSFDLMNITYKDKEDFDQVLGSWGVPEGIWIVIPFGEGKSLRKHIASIGEFFVSPSSYLPTKEAIFLADGVSAWNTKGELYKQLYAGNLDPYKAIQKMSILRERERLLK